MSGGAGWVNLGNALVCINAVLTAYFVAFRSALDSADARDDQRRLAANQQGSNDRA